MQAKEVSVKSQAQVKKAAANQGVENAIAAAAANQEAASAREASVDAVVVNSVCGVPMRVRACIAYDHERGPCANLNENSDARHLSPVVLSGTLSFCPTLTLCSPSPPLSSGSSAEFI